MHMTKEEFQEQLKSSLDGVDDMPPLDGEHHRLFLAELRFQTDGGVRQRNAWMRCGLTLPIESGREVAEGCRFWTRVGCGGRGEENKMQNIS